MTDEWPCANFTEPVTCLSAGVTVTGRCDHCRNQPEMTDGQVKHLTRVVRGLETSLANAEGAIECLRALIPNECWVLRSTADGPVCTDMVGGGFKDGPKWTEDMCCLPCRLRAALATNTT